MADKTYTLAHPLDAQVGRRKSPFTDKDLQAGDQIKLNENQAAALDNAGYLVRDADGPVVGVAAGKAAASA